MLVTLKELHPNPYRDFMVDPIDQDHVERLKKSIQEFGFWGGIVCRRSKGHYEIVVGHHRVIAAMEAGIESAEVFIREDLDDAGMLHILARDNCYQGAVCDGNLTAARLSGIVTMAVRFLVKAALEDKLDNKKVQKKVLQQIQSEKGIGWSPVITFLDSVPQITRMEVYQTLKSLKAAGEYARIIHEVVQEFERVVVPRNGN